MSYFQCSLGGDGCLDVKLTTVDYGSEISWSLGPCQSLGQYGNNHDYIQACCLGEGSYNLECKDSYGDGWNGGYIEVDGQKYCENFTSGYVIAIKITVLASGNYLILYFL